MQFTRTDKKDPVHLERLLRRQVKQGTVLLAIVVCGGILASYLAFTLGEMITLFYYWESVLIFTLFISITQIFRTLSVMLAILQKRLDHMETPRTTRRNSNTTPPAI